MAEDLEDREVEGLVEAAVVDEAVAVAAAEEVAAVFEDSIRHSRMEQCFIKEATERWMRRTFR